MEVEGEGVCKGCPRAATPKTELSDFLISASATPRPW